MHDPYTDDIKLVIYQDQLEGGLRFPLDPFVKLFLNRYNIALGQLHPNSYRILTGYIELMHKEGREPNFDLLRHMYSLNSKKEKLTFSLAIVPNLNLFSKLQDLPKSWRHRYFIIEHPSEFFSIRRLWVDDCHKIKWPTKLPSEDSELAIRLHQRCLAKGTSAKNYSQ